VFLKKKKPITLSFVFTMLEIASRSQTENELTNRIWTIWSINRGN